MKMVFTAAFLLTAVAIAGCGGGGSSSSSTTTTTISGTVADGYLAGAEVFLDKNGNYQWDGVEPKTTTNSNGAYSMTVSVTDVGIYPMVAHAIAGVTIDKDTNTAVANSFVMSAPVGATGFISPMSTLIREKLAANPGMTLTEAMTQLRNQMNLSAGINMMADYVAGSQSGMNAAEYQKMHNIAQQMVGLMAGQAAQVMPSGNVNVNRYHSMMATINTNMPGITINATSGLGMNSVFMTTMMTTMQTQLGAISTTGGFMNYSAMFRNMTSSRYFWDTSSGNTSPMTPMSGGVTGTNSPTSPMSGDVTGTNSPTSPMSGGMTGTNSPTTPMSGGMM